MAIGGNEVARLWVSVSADTSKARSALSSLSSSVSSAAKGISGLAEGPAKAAGKLGGIFDTIKGKVKAFFQDIANGQNGVVNFFGQIGDAADGVRSVVGALAQVGQQVIGSAAKMETFQSQFEVFLGSASAAKARLADLAEFGKTTPFLLPEIVEASRILQNYAGSALAAGDGIRMVGDIAAGSGKSIVHISTLVGRLYDALTSGRNVGEPLLYLAEAGAIGGEARREIEALAKQVQDGAITGEEAWAKASESFAKFAGMTERLSQTTEGKWSNLMDSIGMGLASIGEELLPVTKAAIDALIPVVDGAAAAIKQVVIFALRLHEALRPLAPLFGVLSALTSVLTARFLLMKAVAFGAAMVRGIIGTANALKFLAFAIKFNALTSVKLQAAYALLSKQTAMAARGQVVMAGATLKTKAAVAAGLIPALGRWIALQTAATAKALLGVKALVAQKVAALAASAGLKKLGVAMVAMAGRAMAAFVAGIVAGAGGLAGFAVSAWAAVTAFAAFAAPFLIAAAVIGAAVAALFWAFENNFLGIRDIVSGIADFLAGPLGLIADLVGSVIDIVGAAWDFITGNQPDPFGEAAAMAEAAKDDYAFAVEDYATALPEALEAAGRRSKLAVRETMSGVASEIRAGRQAIVDAMTSVIDATYTPLELAGKQAAIEAELNSTELREKLRSSDPDIRRDAEQRRLDLLRQLDQVRVDMTKFGTDAQRIQALNGLLSMKGLVDGMKSNDKALRAEANAAALAIYQDIAKLSGKSQGWGYQMFAAWADGITGAAKAKLPQVKGAYSPYVALMKADSPPGPKSPLHRIDVWGERTGAAWSEGIARALTSGQAAVRGALGGFGARAVPAPALVGAGAGGTNVYVNIGSFYGNDENVRDLSRRIGEEVRYTTVRPGAL